MSGKKSINRREFLQRTAGTAVGAAGLAYIASSSASSETTSVAPAARSETGGRGNNKKPIRVGLIRCDLHAMYYGVLMFKHDPIVLRDDKIGRGHAAYFYFYTHYNQPRRLMVPNVSGFNLTRVWDEDRKTAENMSRMFDRRPYVCNRFEEVSDDVDLVFIADCNGDGSDHLKLTGPGLEKGVPTFLDKPFAYDVKDALALVKMANKHNVPLMSLSMLRVVPQAALFRNRLKELGEPEFGTVRGFGGSMAGHIHSISLGQHIFGAGVESVECMGPRPLAHIFLDYGGKAGRPKAGVVLNCKSGGAWHASMYVSAYSRMGAIHSPRIGDFEFPYGARKIAEMIKTMVETGQPQASYEETVECIAIATAGRLAQKRGKRVHLKEVMA